MRDDDGVSKTSSPSSRIVTEGKHRHAFALKMPKLLICTFGKSPIYGMRVDP